MVIQEAGNPQRNLHEEAAALLGNQKVPNALIPFVRNPSVMSFLRRIDTKHRGFAVKILDYSHRDDIGNLVIFNQVGSRVYASDRNKNKDGKVEPVVYTTEEERSPSSFVTVAGFLDTKANNRVEYDPKRAAGIAMFGTINTNLSGGGEGWMEQFEEKVHKITSNNPDWPAEVTVFNPNVGVGTQEKTKREGLDMDQFARESHNLFHSEVVVMNFEPKRGGLALAELRMAMLASLLTGHKLIVRMEQPDMSDINVIRSRVVAETDLDFFRAKFQDRLNMDYYPPGKLPLEQLPEVALEAYKMHQGLLTHRERYQVPPRPKGEKKIVLSGSSSNARDMALRLEITEQLKQRGDEVIDTYFDDFDGRSQPDMESKMEFMRKSRMAELDDMLGATDNLVYAGKGSLSQFGQVTTALLFSALKGSRVHVLLGKDPRDDYDGGTYRSHSARVFMDYQIAKFLHINAALGGLSPELGRKIPAISDRIAPVVKSIHGSVFENVVARIKHLRHREKDIDLPKITNVERLVPKDFQYGQEQIREEVKKASHKVYQEYEQQTHGERIRMSPEEFHLLEEKDPETWGRLVGSPGNRPAYFVDNAHRYSFDKSAIAGTDDIRTMTAKDFAQHQLHPFAKDMLVEGALSGPGFYYRFGENLTVDSVILREYHGKLQALLIDRGDHQGIGLPGGMIEAKDLNSENPERAALKQAIQEVIEEAGTFLDGIPGKALNSEPYVVGDPRATLQSWPATRIFLFIPPDKIAKKMRPKKGSDANAADWDWIDVNGEMFGSHKSYLWLGIKEWERQTGRVVRNDGVVGIAA